ncbi:MAG: thioredoxin domain-containing protein [Minisyncoccia bacterium]
MKSSLSIPFAILAAGIIVALAVYFSVAKPAPGKLSAGDSALVRPVSTNDHILGNPAASVFIVEYADFDCTYCKQFNDTLDQVIANDGATGKVALVFREFPLTELHPNALLHAEAAECVANVGGNDAFWKFADLLFANQPVDPTRYGEYAASAGVASNDAFASCFANASSTVGGRINADRQNALSIGAQGTPYSLILVSGQAPVVLDGASSYDAVKELVDKALGEAQ